MGNGPGHLSNYSHRIQSSLMKRRSYHRAIEAEVVAEDVAVSSPHRATTYVIPPGHGRAPRASYDVDGNDLERSCCLYIVHSTS